jgi:hypothetical protein
MDIETAKIQLEDRSLKCSFRTFYCRMAEHLPDGARVVECGVNVGGSIHYLYLEMLVRRKLFDFHVVDIWEGNTVKEQFIADSAAIGFQYKMFQEDAIKCADRFPDEFFDLVFLDDDHNFEHVKKEIDAWLPKVVPGGILGGHDYTHDPVRLAVEETCGAKESCSKESWWYWRKPA